MDRERIWALARSCQPFAVAVRRHLHQHPELSYQERETSAYVAARLQAMGWSVQIGIGGYGIKAVLKGPRPGPTVALRADMDALPITEETGLPFASRNPGVMHACGHDVHTATLLGAARALKTLQEGLAGQVVLIFQPGEEVNPGGASLMIQDGVLENPRVDVIFALHVLPQLEAGTMAFGAGPLLAAPDAFDVTIIGQGGHGAAPHLTVDPVLVACQAITLLQQIVARNTSPFDRAVVTVGVLSGGTARNVIPDQVTFQGTIRTMDPTLRERTAQRIEEVIRGVCDAAGAAYRLDLERGYPVLVNDPEATDRARIAAVKILGEEKVLPMDPSMGGEDFAYFLQKVPGSFARLGSTTPGVLDPPGLHSSRLQVDEGCITVGIAYYVSVVLEYLK